MEERDVDLTLGPLEHEVADAATVLRTAASLLRDHWKDLDDEARDDLLDAICTKAALVSDVLKAVIPVLPDSARPDVSRLLRRSPQKHSPL